MDISSLLRPARLFAALALLLAAAGSVSATPTACAALAALKGTGQDAASALRGCIDATPVKGVVAIPAGEYIIRSPIVVVRPVTLATAGLAPKASPCIATDKRCAHIIFLMGRETVNAVSQPIFLRTADAGLDHLILEGSRLRDPRTAMFLCRGLGTTRNLGGGIRTEGDRLQVTNSVFRDIACASAFEYHSGVDSRIANNLFIANGDHTIWPMWSDGLTVHDAARLRVIGNRFIDNTDVQAVFGGCTDCVVSGNRFSHEGSELGGSFAELVLHAWPNATSGRYDGTIVTHNDIDCSPAKRCGFGLQIGAMPWYRAPTSGGAVTGNRIANAELAINIDELTGPMTIRGNMIVGGPVIPATLRPMTACGPRDVVALANISPNSRRFLSADSLNDPTMKKAMATSFANCVFNAVPR